MCKTSVFVDVTVFLAAPVYRIPAGFARFFYPISAFIHQFSLLPMTL